MAAGLGFKTFTTGEVLTAADTNGYLMQGVLVFASAAARDAAITSPQEGQCCYLKDTDAVLTYSGAAWVGFDDSNAIQNTIVDAKGDIVAASGSDTPARLAVGNNGETLVADSSQTTGLAYREDYAAGKNAIINGAFNVWQRGTSFSNNTTGDVYTADRWVSQVNGTGTRTITQQTFTAGTAPVAGYEGTFFLRMGCSSSGTSTYFNIKQKIENVRTFAGQTVTVSFWAKASASLTTSFFGLTQDFGSGGSTAVDTAGTNLTFTTSYVRYTQTFAIPSISGKTIGTGSNLALAISFGSGTFTSFDIWGVQVEDGSVATAFNTATGTLQGELAACQRYYYRATTISAYGRFATGFATGATGGLALVPFPVTMRAESASMDVGNMGYAEVAGGVQAITPTMVADSKTLNCIQVTFGGISGLTTYRPGYLIANNSTSAFIGFSAEL